jgi:hypothetical protein
MIQYDTTIPCYKSWNYFNRAWEAASRSCGQLNACQFIEPEGSLQCTQGPFMKTMPRNLNKFHIPTFYWISISTLPTHLNANFQKGCLPCRSLANTLKRLSRSSCALHVPPISSSSTWTELHLHHFLPLTSWYSSHLFALRYPQFMSFPKGEILNVKPLIL